MIPSCALRALAPRADRVFSGRNLVCSAARIEDTEEMGLRRMEGIPYAVGQRVGADV